MSSTEVSQDINEAFENLLFAEENAEKEGFAEGFKSGKTQLIDGYHSGYHRAYSIAAQLGYYTGVLEYYLQNDNDNKKAVLLADKILQDINNFPKYNDKTVDILKLAHEIKLKYLKFCSLTKINLPATETAKLDF